MVVKSLGLGVFKDWKGLDKCELGFVSVLLFSVWNSIEDKKTIKTERRKRNKKKDNGGKRWAFIISNSIYGF